MPPPVPYDETQLARLRGGLPASANSARDLAITAQTACVRRRALAVTGASADAAARLLGPTPAVGQSPFAIGLGNRFEAYLKADGCAALLKALREQLGLPKSATSIVDLDAELPWPSRRTKKGSSKRRNVARARKERTDSLLLAAVRREPGAPTLVAHPRFELVVNDSARDVEPDFIVLWPRSGRPRIGEAKSYADHGHRTETAKLATTRHQTAVYFLALEQALARLRANGKPRSITAAKHLCGPWPGEEEVVSSGGIRAVVILRRPSGMWPSVHVEDIRRDIDLVRRGLARTPASLGELLSTLPAGATLDTAATLEALPTCYEPGWCLGSCPLSLSCRDRVEAAAAPSYFGGAAPSVLAPAGTMRIANQLARGRRKPRNAEETAFAERMRPLRARIDEARKRC